MSSCAQALTPDASKDWQSDSTPMAPPRRQQPRTAGGGGGGDEGRQVVLMPGAAAALCPLGLLASLAFPQRRLERSFARHFDRSQAKVRQAMGSGRWRLECTASKPPRAPGGLACTAPTHDGGGCRASGRWKIKALH